MISSVLDGYYEEGYHYYIEIRDNRLLVRDYARRPELETTFSCDRKTLKSGERTVLNLKNPVLSRDAKGEPFTWIKELAYEGGRLEMDYYFTVMGDTHYTLEKVDHGPFAHLEVRDREFLKQLQGEWVDGINPKSTLTVSGNTITLKHSGYTFLKKKVHVISYVTDPKRVLIVDESLTNSDLGAVTDIEVRPNMLTFREIVFDASTPLKAFVRRADLGKIELPSGVHDPMRNTMVCEPLCSMADVPAFNNIKPE